MKPLILSMFVSQTIGLSNVPGAGLNSATLAGVKKDPAVVGAVGPNDSFFDAASNNSQNPGPAINLIGITDEVAAGFVKGKKYKVTIEEDIPVADSAVPAAPPT